MLAIADEDAVPLSDELAMLVLTVGGDRVGAVKVYSDLRRPSTSGRAG